jgi:hypothetical protein
MFDRLDVCHSGKTTVVTLTNNAVILSGMSRSADHGVENHAADTETNIARRSHN